MRWCLSDYARVDSRLRGFSYSCRKELQMQKGMRYPLPVKHGALGGESDGEFDRREQKTESNPQGRVVSVRVRDVCVRDGRAVRPRGHGDDQRAGADAALPGVHPV